MNDGGTALRGLLDGFESYRVLGRGELERVLAAALIALDTSFLLNLYRYNSQTATDLVQVLSGAGSRLFIPHQVAREFWRNRSSVIRSLGNPAKDIDQALVKNERSTSDAIARWSASVSISESRQEILQKQVRDLFQALRTEAVVDLPQVTTATPTCDDQVLAQLLDLLNGRVGLPLSEDEWRTAVAEGERRVEDSIPPGYMDSDKTESNLEEGASGDYLVWYQLIKEGKARGLDLVLVTSDVKEDWWESPPSGKRVAPRRELVLEYMDETGFRFHILTPATLLTFARAVGGREARGETVAEVERLEDQDEVTVPWTRDAVDAVLKRLDATGYAQAAAIREAIANGGRITRARIYELAERTPPDTLRGFTRPVKRVTAELQSEGIVPGGLWPPLFDAVYETGVKSSHFQVPDYVVELFDSNHAAED